MQTIERYGVIVLVLCAVSIGAVWMWERGDDPQASDTERTAAATTVPPRAEHVPIDRPKQIYDRIGTRAKSALKRETLEELKETGTDLITSASERLKQLADATPTPNAATPSAAAPTVIVPSNAVPTPANLDQRSTPKAVPAVAGRDNIYIVKVGDTLSEVSLSQLGTSKRWGDIVKANPGLDPQRLRVGMRLLMPAAGPTATPVRTDAPTVATSAAPKQAGKGQVRVESGDSLWKIAARALGDGTRYHELVKANPGIDPDHLLVGQLLALPDGSKPAPAAAKKPGPVVAENTSRRGKVL